MKFYNPNEEKSYIMYLDANNLYGWAMSQPLPYRSFKWVKTDKIIEKKEGIGHIYEVDLEYPKGLHNHHNDYPCAPEKMVVKDEMLSPYCEKLKEKFKISSGNVQKLVQNLNDKKIMFCMKEI